MGLVTQKDYPSLADTLNLTRIPMWLMRGQQGEINMCINFNEHLCGNLEVRHILTNLFRYLGEEQPKDANSRILKCREIVTKNCLDMYGQVYHWYGQVIHEACGIKDTGWSNTSIVTTR